MVIYKNMNKNSEKIKFNIIAIGDRNVGKTTIIHRYITNEFSQETVCTSGYIENIKKLTMKDDEKILLNLVDTSGQEQYKSLAFQYVKNISTVLFVFDLSDKKSFNNIKQWIQFFNDNASDINIPKYLIGNKKDLEKEVNEDMIDIFLEENKGFIYKETSAKESYIEINDLFQEIAENLYDMYKTNKDFKEKHFKKMKLNKEEGDKGGCC